MAFEWPAKNIARYSPDPHRRLTGLVPRVKASELDGTCGGGGDGVTSIAEQGQAQITGNATLSEGANITLTQAGQDIEIAATGSSTFDPAYGDLYYDDHTCLLPVPLTLANVGVCDDNYSRIESLSLKTGPTENTTLDPVTGTITATEAGVYLVHFSISLKGDNSSKLVSAFLNDTVTNIKARHFQVSALNDTINMRAEGILELDANDVVDVRITDDNLVAEDIAIYYFQFSIIRIA